MFKKIKRLWIMFKNRNNIIYIYEDEQYQFDLTSIFGRGNEPTTKEMDTLLNIVRPSKWFN